MIFIDQNHNFNLIVSTYGIFARSAVIIGILYKLVVNIKYETILTALTASCN